MQDNEKLKSWERLQDNLPGGPGDDSDLEEDDTDHISQSAFERKVEYADNRRKEKQEDELIRSMDRSRLGVSRKNFDPRLDGPWNYEGPDSKY
jgi:hypothetical protein